MDSQQSPNTQCNQPINSGLNGDFPKKKKIFYKFLKYLRRRIFPVMIIGLILDITGGISQ